MAVVAKDTVLRCKLCASDWRTEIDRLLERRSKREKAEDGSPINLDYVLVELARLGVENPNADNIKNHWKKHCEVIPEAELAEREQAVGELVERLNEGGIVFADADAALDWIITQGLTEQQVKLADGGRVGITIDHILKAIDSKTKRKHNEAQDELLKGLGAAIGASAVKALGGGQKAIPAQTVEAEPVEEADFTEIES